MGGGWEDAEYKQTGTHTHIHSHGMWGRRGGWGARPQSHSELCATQRSRAVLQRGEKKREVSDGSTHLLGCFFFCDFKRRAKNTPS